MGTVWAARVSDATSSSRSEARRTRVEWEPQHRERNVKKLRGTEGAGLRSRLSQYCASLGYVFKSYFADYPKIFGSTAMPRLPESRAGSALHQGLLHLCLASSSASRCFKNLMISHRDSDVLRFGAPSCTALQVYENASPRFKI